MYRLNSKHSTSSRNGQARMGSLHNRSSHERSGSSSSSVRIGVREKDNPKGSKYTPDRGEILRRTSSRPELEISHRYAEGTSSSIRELSKRSIGLSRRSSRNFSYGQSQLAKEPKPSVRPGNTSLRPNQPSSQYILSLIEHTTHQVGLAAYNCSTSQIHLAQIRQRMTYVQTISTITRFSPRQIIYCLNQEDSPLSKKVVKTFRGSVFKGLKRSFFDQTRGLKIYSERGNKEDPNPESKVMKMVACAALSALMVCLEHDLMLNVRYSSLHINWHYPEHSLIIDQQTVSDLELFLCKESGDSANSFLNNFKCLTFGGTRMLRANLLQPLFSQASIEDRLDTVFYLLGNPHASEYLKAQLPKYKALEPILVKFIQSPKYTQSRACKSYIHYILLMCTFLTAAEQLSHELQQSLQQSNQSQNRGKTLQTLLKMIQDPRVDQIRRCIQENLDMEVLGTFDGSSRNRKDNYIFLVRLDKIKDEYAHISRVTYSHIIEDIIGLFEGYKLRCRLPLKLNYAERRGYFLSTQTKNPSVDLRKFSQIVQQDVVHISPKASSVSFQTPSLVSLNNKLRVNQERILQQSEPILADVVKNIQDRLDILFEINYWISMADMLLAFASFVRFYSSVKFCRPVFVNNVSLINFKGLSTIWTHERFLKPSERRDFLITQLRPMVVLSKATEDRSDYHSMLVSVAYLVILSQIGCPLPVQSYVGNLFHMLLSKLGNSESVQNSLSHFQYEVTALNGLLEVQRIDQPSLILLDQILTGTNYEEEVSLSLGFVKCLRGSKGFVIALVSDNGLIEHLKNLFSYVHVLFDSKPEQSIKEICMKTGFDEGFMRILEENSRVVRRPKPVLSQNEQDNLGLLEQDFALLSQIASLKRIPSAQQRTRLTHLKQYLLSLQNPFSSSDVRKHTESFRLGFNSKNISS